MKIIKMKIVMLEVKAEDKANFSVTVMYDWGLKQHNLNISREGLRIKHRNVSLNPEYIEYVVRFVIEQPNTYLYVDESYINDDVIYDAVFSSE